MRCFVLSLLESKMRCIMIIILAFVVIIVHSLFLLWFFLFEITCTRHWCTSATFRVMSAHRDRISSRKRRLLVLYELMSSKNGNKKIGTAQASLLEQQWIERFRKNIARKNDSTVPILLMNQSPPTSAVADGTLRCTPKSIISSSYDQIFLSLTIYSKRRFKILGNNSN